MEWTTKAIVASICSGIAWVFGGWDVLAQVLIVCIILDIVAGFVRAAAERKVNSSVMGRGVLKKTGYFIAVLLAVMLDRAVFDQSPIARTLIISYLIVNESLSILEHLALLGVPIPYELKNTLMKLRQKQEVGRDDPDNGKTKPKP